MNDDGLGSFLWPGTQVPTGTPQGCDMSVFSNGGATIIGSNIPPHPNLDAMMNFVQWQQQAGLAGFNRPQPFPIMPQNPSSVLPNAVTTVPVVENPDSTTATAGAPKKKGRPPGSKNKKKECSGLESSDQQKIPSRLQFTDTEKVRCRSRATCKCCNSNDMVSHNAEWTRRSFSFKLCWRRMTSSMLGMGRTARRLDGKKLLRSSATREGGSGTLNNAKRNGPT
jgi:hypothetical protein